jgi:hypothetical protein
VPGRHVYNQPLQVTTDDPVKRIRHLAVVRREYRLRPRVPSKVQKPSLALAAPLQQRKPQLQAKALSLNISGLGGLSRKRHKKPFFKNFLQKILGQTPFKTKGGICGYYSQ